jgi:hypothetical protein
VRTSSGRSQAFIPAVVVVVVVLVGFFAMRSRGDDGKNDTINTVERTKNCSPIARADAAATRPGETVLVDVLANDTDADGDSLVFQILKTDGGTSEIDDGDTPTDSADDRLAFTPSEPPVDSATIEYQALDPQGGFSTSTVTVAVNPDAKLPDGVRSALASDPAAEGTESGRCGDTVDTTSTTLDSGPVGPETAPSETTTTIVEDTSDTTTGGRRTATTRRSGSGSGSSSNRTTTTRKSSSGGSTNTTSKPTTNTTDAPSVTAPGDPGSGNTTTTKPPTTVKPDPTCGTPQSNPDFNQCMRDTYSHPTTSAPPTTP